MKPRGSARDNRVALGHRFSSRGCLSPTQTDGHNTLTHMVVTGARTRLQISPSIVSSSQAETSNASARSNNRS